MIMCTCKVLSTASVKHSTPVNAVLATCTASALILCLPFDELVEIANAAAAVGYFILFASMYYLQQEYDNEASPVLRPFAIPGGSCGMTCMMIPPTLCCLLSLLFLSGRAVVLFVTCTLCVLLWYYRCLSNDARKLLQFVHNEEDGTCTRDCHSVNELRERFTG